MADLYAEQWGLIPLTPFLMTWSVGLAPPLLIRFVLIRRPISDGWALGVAALFWILDFAVFAALDSQRETNGALILVAIVSYLILTAGKKDYVPAVSRSHSREPTVGSSDIVAASQTASNKKRDEFSTSASLAAPADRICNRESMKLETRRSKESGFSATKDEAELRRYDMAWREIETGDTHRGLWGRAFLKAEGDEKKTKVQYLKERTEFLKKVEQRQEEQRRAQKLREQQIQKQKEREREARTEGLSKAMQRQVEERQHQSLLKQISLEQREKVDMLRKGINESDKWKEFKLTSAAQFGPDETVFTLLAAGANPLLRDSFEHTARDYAKQNGRTEIAQQLAIAERLWKQRRSASIHDPGTFRVHK